MSEQNPNNNPFQFPTNSLCYLHFNHCHHFPQISVLNFQNFPHLCPQSSPKLWLDNYSDKNINISIQHINNIKNEQGECQQKMHQKNTQKKNEDKLPYCQCVKTQCLKQYCFCYKNGTACSIKCNCNSCKNNQNELNQKRNLEKKKRVSCKCTKSQCKKKYCECYTVKKKCEDFCKCIGCQN